MIEILMAEYYDLDEAIERGLAAPIAQSFFGRLDRETTLDQALPLLLRCYRLYVLKQALQGQYEIDEKIIISDKQKAKQLDDFLNVEILSEMK